VLFTPTYRIDFPAVFFLLLLDLKRYDKCTIETGLMESFFIQWKNRYQLFYPDKFGEWKIQSIN